MNHNSSARKKLLQYQDDLKRSQIRSNLFQRTLSREHSKFMQNVLRENIQKQQSDRVLRRQLSSSRHYQSNQSNQSNKFSEKNRFIDVNVNQFNSINSIHSSGKYKQLKTSKNKDREQIRVQDVSSNNQENNYNNNRNIINNNNNNNITNNNNNSRLNVITMNQTDEIRSARQNQLLQAKKIPFQFSFLSYSIQLLIGYGLTFGILYLIQVSNFPYYQLLLILALTLTISPFKISNFLMLITSIPIVISNYYLNLSALTYFQIFICYIAVMMFNQKHKVKILFLFVLAIQLIFGFLIFPRLSRQFYIISKGNSQIYYYIFPLFMFILRNITQYVYYLIGYSTLLFLQIPLFIIGLQYGTILSVPVSDIQFWYLIVVFTLQIMNQRTHFTLKIMIDIGKYCFGKKNGKKSKTVILAGDNTNNNNSINNIITNDTPIPSSKPTNNHILPSHSNGYSSLNSFHLICLIYIFTQLPLFASPYSSQTNLSSYTKDEKYKPLIIWSLSSVYEIMCMILKRNKKNVLLYGYTSNRWYDMIIRGAMLVIGMWLFYMGLAVGKMASQSINK